MRADDEHKNHVTVPLLRLVGLRLSIARDAGNMKNFQFGTIGPHPSGKGTIGEFELELSGGFRLQVFPDGSREEDWRFFAPGSEEGHVVIAGGRAK